MSHVFLPKASAPVAGAAFPTREYYIFFQSVAQNVNVAAGVQAEVDDLKMKVDSLNSDGNPIFGIDSVYAVGPIGNNQRIEISLVGDVASPGFTQYYGSDTTGTNGWFNVSDTLAVTSYLTKTVADTGVTTFDLADAGNTASGTLQAITVDAKGRVSGTTDATIMGTDGHIAVANGNASAGRPTIDLDAAMVALIDFLVAVSPSPRVTSDGSYRVTDSGAYRVTA